MSQCLICERPAAVTPSGTTPTSSNVEGNKGTMFFLLRKVLQVPDNLLLKFLEGSSSSTPLGICGPCQETVKDCHAVHEQLIQVKRQWNDCKAKVVNKIKDAETPTVVKIEGQVRGQPVKQEKEKEEGLRGETRRFVVSHVYPTTAPVKGHKVVLGTSTPKVVTAGPRLSCVFCAATFLHTTNLETHMNSHTREKPFICRTCGWEFATPDKLRRHQVERHLRKAFQCAQCKKGFGRKYHLERHLETHLAEDKLPFKCGVCEKAFAQKNNLERHQVVHTGEKRFECDKCGKRFTQGNNLARHKYIYNH